MKPLLKLIVTQSFGANPQYYQQFGLKGHEGTDFKTKGLGLGSFWSELMGWQNALAVRDGICTAYYAHPYYGTYVDLVDNDGNLYKYCHLKNARPPSADSVIPSKDLKYRVKAGDILGITGNSGNSTAPHLHFMFRPKNFNSNNGYFGYEDPMKLFSSSGVSIARIGTNLPPFSELQAQVSKFTKGKLSITCVDYNLPITVPGMFTQDDAYKFLLQHPIQGDFVQFYYQSSNAPFLASYSFPNLKKQISTLPNNPPSNLLAFEFAHCLQNYCNDNFNAHIQVNDSNFPDEAFTQAKYDTLTPYLDRIGGVSQ